MTVSPLAEVTMRVGQTIRCGSQCSSYFGGRMWTVRERFRQAVKANDFEDAEAELMRMETVAQKGDKP